jgi:hypothetical protein
LKPATVIPVIPASVGLAPRLLLGLVRVAISRSLSYRFAERGKKPL